MYVGGIVGFIMTEADNAITISDCIVEGNSNIVSSSYSAGGIVGRIQPMGEDLIGTINISNCNFKNSEIEAGYSVAGILGGTTYTNKVNISDCIVADSTINCTGNNEIGDCLWYLNPFRPSCVSTFPYNGSGTFHTRLGEHCFYRPTEAYADT